VKDNNAIVEFQGKKHEIPSGTRVDEFLQAHLSKELPDTILSALVNRRQVMLDFPLRGDVQLELIEYGSKEAEHVYKRSVSLLFYEACQNLYPDVRLIIGQSLVYSYHYQVRGDVKDRNEMAKKLADKMREIVKDRRPFTRETVTLEQVEDYFTRNGVADRLLLLESRRSSTVHTINCGEFIDIAHGPYAPHTGCLPTFDVVPYEEGLLLRFPSRRDRERLPNLVSRPQLVQTYLETQRWQELLGVHMVGQLNRLCINGEISDVIRISEGLHEKKIAQIADDIARRRDRIRIVAIAGPSASGKTTFAKRLSVQLKVNAIQPIALSLDNYYVNRAETPLDDEGNYDFENIEALDLPLFNSHLVDLLAGKEIKCPRFDFVSGARRPEEKWDPVRLGRNQVLLIEGIHGLNPQLMEKVTRDQKYQIYVSALSQLAIDDHNRLFTSDGRLLRRLVRDRLFRGFTTDRTLDLWPRVRKGEGRWIFPYQENADVIFNSALVYEPAVLKLYAERFLLEVQRDSETYPEAYRLLKFLNLFVSIFSDEVPHTSILREFIGSSAFSY
jgi:uridine kinase